MTDPASQSCRLPTPEPHSGLPARRLGPLGRPRARLRTPPRISPSDRLAPPATWQVCGAAVTKHISTDEETETARWVAVKADTVFSAA